MINNDMYIYNKTQFKLRIWDAGTMFIKKKCVFLQILFEKAYYVFDLYAIEEEKYRCIESLDYHKNNDEKLQ